MIKIGNISKTGVQSNIEHLVFVQQEPGSSMAQAGAPGILVWRHASELLKDPKMVTAQARLLGQQTKVVLSRGLAIDSFGPLP